MSDIPLHFTRLDLALAAPIVGIGLSALAWRKRWYFGAPLGAIVGCVAWAVVRILL